MLFYFFSGPKKIEALSWAVLAYRPTFPVMLLEISRGKSSWNSQIVKIPCLNTKVLLMAHQAFMGMG